MLITLFASSLLHCCNQHLYILHMQLSQDSNWKLYSQHAHFLPSHSLSFGFLGFLIAFYRLSPSSSSSFVSNSLLCLFFQQVTSASKSERRRGWCETIDVIYISLYACLHKGLILLTNSFNFLSVVVVIVVVWSFEDTRGEET